MLRASIWSNTPVFSRGTEWSERQLVWRRCLFGRCLGFRRLHVHGLILVMEIGMLGHEHIVGKELLEYDELCAMAQERGIYLRRGR